MRLLLDTHIWLWSLQSPQHLGHRVRQELKNSTNGLWLSPISTWEALLLHSQRKIELPKNLREWVALAVAPFREVPLTHEIALAAEQVIPAYRDPAEGFLAATAQVLDLTLVTADARLLGLGEIATLANR